MFQQYISLNFEINFFSRFFVNESKQWLYLKPGMEQTETERQKIGLKHGNGIFEHGTIKKQNTIKNF